MNLWLKNREKKKEKKKAVVNSLGSNKLKNNVNMLAWFIMWFMPASSVSHIRWEFCLMFSFHAI